MEKWLLLVLTGAAILVSLQGLRWMWMTWNLPANELEKVVGLDMSRGSLVDRATSVRFFARKALLLVLSIMLISVFALAKATYYAFLPWTG